MGQPPWGRRWLDQPLRACKLSPPDPPWWEQHWAHLGWEGGLKGVPEHEGQPPWGRRWPGRSPEQAKWRPRGARKKRILM